MIRHRADSCFDDGPESPALGQEDRLAVQGPESRPRRRQERPQNPSSWSARALGEYFGQEMTRLAAGGRLKGFAGWGSVGIISAHAREWMSAGVPPEQIKADIDYFVVHLEAYMRPGKKAAVAFLNAAPAIRLKTSSNTPVYEEINWVPLSRRKQ